MAHRIEAALKPEFADSAAAAIKRRLQEDFGMGGIDDAAIVDVYSFEGNLSKDELEKLASELLSDPISQVYAIGKPVNQKFSFAIEVGLRPGVKDNVGETAREGAADLLSRDIGQVFTSKLYLFTGEFDEKRAKEVAEGLLCNPLIQSWKPLPCSRIFDYYSTFEVPHAGVEAKGTVLEIPLDVPDEELAKISKKRLLALSVDEMKVIAAYYANPKTMREREKAGMGTNPTDVELECIAQTWSEHCKHKIFNAKITYTEGKKKTEINSLFKTYIAKTTEKIGKKVNYLVSVFKDNAGVISLDSDWNLAMKVETHNTPSALDPYGGALTGILGVNRDIIGVGIGAKPIFNTDVFCFADPFYKGQIPPRLLHPKRVFEGVRAGVERGGNASGIPTVNGSIFFDDRYLGKPIVYCGTGGLMPAKINGKNTEDKPMHSGDRIFSIGGRIGKDGIHGATFSSEALHEGSPTSAVQLGDPFTQKKALDFLMAARDKGLISGLQDMGAGGLSSSIGEMASWVGGAIIHLERAPLKYPGLDPWEILLSESQERMAAGVPADKAGEFAALAAEYSVEATDIGNFTDSGHFVVLYQNYPVLYLNLHFLHEGYPKMELEASWKMREERQPEFECPSDLSDTLLKLLARPNICSKESIVRQYDHEVMGMSVIKPICGKMGTGPSDSAVLRPFPEKKIGIAVSHGMCVHAGDIDPYWMAALGVDEAVRNYVASGGGIGHWGALDNFCWPDPIKTAANPDGDMKLGALVRANMGLADACTAYSLPLISGKDSMKNDYKHGEWKISIPPTLLISVVGKVDDVERAISTDFKHEGDEIFAIGIATDEMGGSEYLISQEADGGVVPKANFEANLGIYKKLHHAIQKGLVASAHDISDGGLAVALAECAIGGGIGCDVDLGKAPTSKSGMRDDFLLFNEASGRFIVSVKPQDSAEFSHVMSGCPVAKIGKITSSGKLEIRRDGKTLVSCAVQQCEETFKGTITW